LVLQVFERSVFLFRLGVHGIPSAFAGGGGHLLGSITLGCTQLGR
jgi:hypothetical protein